MILSIVTHAGHVLMQTHADIGARRDLDLLPSDIGYLNRAMSVTVLAGVRTIYLHRFGRFHYTLRTDRQTTLQYMSFWSQIVVR